jgi:hypothetical protein
MSHRAWGVVDLGIQTLNPANSTLVSSIDSDTWVGRSVGGCGFFGYKDHRPPAPLPLQTLALMSPSLSLFDRHQPPCLQAPASWLLRPPWHIGSAFVKREEERYITEISFEREISVQRSLDWDSTNRLQIVSAVSTVFIFGYDGGETI